MQKDANEHDIPGRSGSRDSRPFFATVEKSPDLSSSSAISVIPVFPASLLFHDFSRLLLRVNVERREARR